MAVIEELAHYGVIFCCPDDRLTEYYTTSGSDPSNPSSSPGSVFYSVTRGYALKFYFSDLVELVRIDNDAAVKEVVLASAHNNNIAFRNRFEIKVINNQITVGYSLTDDGPVDYYFAPVQDGTYRGNYVYTYSYQGEQAIYAWFRSLTITTNPGT